MVFVHLDKLGRILIPKEVRDEMNAESFELQVEKERLVLKRMKSVDEMCGSMPFLKEANWRKMHDEESKAW